MRNQIVWTTVIVLLALLIYTYVSYYGRPDLPPKDDGKKEDPFAVGPVPELEPSIGLLSKLHGARDHAIGYLANDRARAIYLIDLTEETYLGKLKFNPDSPGGGPSGITISHDGSKLFVTGSKFSNDILVIDSESLELIKQIPGGRYNRIIVPNYEENEAYVLSGHYQDHNIYVLDTESLEIDRTITLTSGPEDAALSPDSKTLYVTMKSCVVFLDLETSEVSRRVDVNTTYWKRIVVHPSGDRLFVINNPDVNGSWPFVEVFNASTGEKVTDIRGLTREPTWDGALTCMDISPDGSALFCVSQGKLMSVVNTTSYKKIASFDVSQRDYTYGRPGHIYFSEDGSKAYLIYWGAVPIDSPRPDSPSIIGVMDTRSYVITKIITLGQYAGAGQMAIRAP